MTTPQVSLILVTYNSAALLPDFATALTGDKTMPAYELIAVDNASSDAPWQQLPSATWIVLPTNIGYGGACNQGAAQATGDYVIFLNPDIGMREGWLSQLIAHLEVHPEVACIAPETLYPGEQRTLHAGIADRPTLPGAALMMRRRDWMVLGGFDEAIFLYWEDTDLCWRAQQSGRRTVVACDTAIDHIRGGSGGGSSRWIHHYIRNGIYAHLKTQSWSRIGWFVLRQLIAWPWRAVRRQPQQLAKALWWNLTRLPQTLALRRAIRARKP
jgi:GT2 family glycosyltransferase